MAKLECKKDSSLDEEKLAEEIFEQGKVVQVSNRFDAPQFCSDFIALAKATGDGVGLHIRQWQKTGKRTDAGVEIHQWVPVRPERL